MEPSPQHPSSHGCRSLPPAAHPGWHRGGVRDSLLLLPGPGAPRGTPGMPGVAARTPSPPAGEAEELFSRESQPVPTRRLSPSPAPSPPLALIKLQVNLPGSGPTPGTKRLPADRDLPSLHLPSVPGTAWSPRCEHAAPRPPTALRAGSWSCSSGCGELGSALHLRGCCPLPEGTALCPCAWGHVQGLRAPTGMQLSTRSTCVRACARFGARWAKPAACLGALKNPARIPAAAVPGWALRSAGARAWPGLCGAGRRGPVLGSIPRDSPNSTCLARCVAEPAPSSGSWLAAPWHPALPASQGVPPPPRQALAGPPQTHSTRETFLGGHRLANLTLPPNAAEGTGGTLHSRTAQPRVFQSHRWMGLG